MKQKIKRVCVVSPVNPPGKFDKNLRHFEDGEWTIGEAVALPGVLLRNASGGPSMFVPISNIASIDYE